ncbi:DUF3953 domain-containing protein [Oceanobacillus limi]|uniref:DUF3953 domain-containing protein n=1 Tax=Oceanobacillus limi TaxID=930131 RepID=UPI003CC7A527
MVSIKKISILLSFIVIFLGIYIIVTNSYNLLPLSLLLISLLFFHSGVELLRKKQRGFAYTYFLVASFNIVVLINIFLT